MSKHFLYPNTKEIEPLEYRWDGYVEVLIWGSDDDTTDVKNWYISKFNGDSFRMDIDPFDEDGSFTAYLEHEDENEDPYSVCVASATNRDFEFNALARLQGYVSSDVLKSFAEKSFATIGVYFVPGDLSFEEKMKAFNAGDLDACLGLCYHYLYGREVEKDVAKGIDFMIRAALDGGSFVALTALGDLYYDNEHLKRNSVEAYAWYDNGELSGHDDQRRDELARLLSSTELEQAKKRSEEIRLRRKAAFEKRASN